MPEPDIKSVIEALVAARDERIENASKEARAETRATEAKFKADDPEAWEFCMGLASELSKLLSDMEGETPVTEIFADTMTTSVIALSSLTGKRPSALLARMTQVCFLVEQELVALDMLGITPERSDD